MNDSYKCTVSQKIFRWHRDFDKRCLSSDFVPRLNILDGVTFNRNVMK